MKPCNQGRRFSVPWCFGDEMAKIIAAYIAHGHRPVIAGARRVDYPLDADCVRQWQRVFCLFSILRAFSDENSCPRFLLVSDHAPPAIDGRMLGFHLERLNVEIHRIDHVWRPDEASANGDFFIFDVMEHLESITCDDDAFLIFSGRSLAVNPIDPLFNALEQRGILCAEESYGELVEEHERALYDRMVELRRHFGIKFPDYAMRAASGDFVGITHQRLRSLIGRLRNIFMKNILRAARAEDYFTTSAELLAALFAEEKIYQPNLAGLSDRAAAMPDDFSVASLSDIPVIIPGYGREPDIATLFHALLGDRLEARETVDRDMIFKLMKRNVKTNSLNLRKPVRNLFRWQMQVNAISN